MLVFFCFLKSFPVSLNSRQGNTYHCCKLEVGIERKAYWLRPTTGALYYCSERLAFGNAQWYMEWVLRAQGTRPTSPSARRLSGAAHSIFRRASVGTLLKEKPRASYISVCGGLAEARNLCEFITDKCFFFVLFVFVNKHCLTTKKIQKVDSDFEGLRFFFLFCFVLFFFRGKAGLLNLPAMIRVVSRVSSPVGAISLSVGSGSSIPRGRMKSERNGNVSYTIWRRLPISYIHPNAHMCVQQWTFE